MQLIAMAGGLSPWAAPSSIDDDPSLYLLGDTLCLMSAVCETAVILNRQQTRIWVPLFTYTAATTAVVAVVAAVFALVFGAGVFCLQDTCLLGWLNPAWAPYLLSYRSVGYAPQQAGRCCIGGVNAAKMITLLIHC
jgi:drug/metabolite transporter (DMT)-like permease